MGRIEEIRKKNKHRALDDNEVQFILSRLEIAEKALERVHEMDDGDPAVSLGRIAREALQQIRE